MRRRMGAAILLAAILVAAVVIVETTSRDPVSTPTGFRFDAQSSWERNIATYFGKSREHLLDRLGAITAVRCAELDTYGVGTAGCDIVFEKAGRQRWYFLWSPGNFIAKPCPAHLQTAPGAEPEGPCNVVVPA